MPPPTSPNRTPLLPQIGILPDSASNSNFMSRDFLSRMNELLANLLNQYTEQADDHTTAMETPHMTTLPAQIRNLASPIRFLAIPDLDLDMDLDMDGPHAGILARLSGPSFTTTEIDDSSTLEVSSDLNEEFENSDNESNSEDSSDANLDDNDIEDDQEEESDQAQNDILNRLQLEQRLLLSSARQNYTNRNTLINFDPRTSSSNSFSGVPLRRQNAIRLKNRPPSACPNLDDLAKEYHADFETIINAIKRLDSFVGKSPLFSHHPHSESRQNLKKWGGLRRLVRRASYEGNMDRFLHHRRKGTLWTELSNRQSESSMAENSHRMPESKRKHFGTNNSPKRRKVANRTSTSNLLLFLRPSGGEVINSKHLSRSDKYKILDGLPCSYLKNGSTFALDLLVRGKDSIDLSFSNVDLIEKIMHGHFSVKASGDRSGHIHLIIGFLSFLCGGIRSRYTINCTNKVIQIKSALLDHTFMEAIVQCGLSSPKVIECLTSAFQIPFSGEIVDFNKNDLRFLQDSRPVSSKSSFSRSMHVSRIRNEQIKLQLGEWMRIRPFHNFSEAFFLNYLFFVERYLRDFRDIPKIERESGIEFAQHMKELIHDITRDFKFMSEANIPMVEEKSNQAKKDIWERRRHEPRSNLHKSSFLQEWETKMCEKLCDYITCEDSCLLNIQLNYVLFTIKVDVSAALDQTFHKFIGLVSKESERKMLQKKYDAVSKEQLLPEARECIFVCSLNRKTGRLEMQNTRLNLDYKYAGSCDARSSLLRESFGASVGSFTDSDDDEYSGPVGRYSVFSSHWKYLEDPYLMDNPTVTSGVLKRGSSVSSSCSGGNGLVNFV